MVIYNELIQLIMSSPPKLLSDSSIALILAYSDLNSYIIQYYHQSPYYQQIVQNMCSLVDVIHHHDFELCFYLQIF
jgi:hypothetical protein